LLVPAQQKINYIDHSQNDARLKGFFTPEGIKLEIVAAALPAQKTVLGNDGWLYVTSSSRVYRCRPDGSDKREFAIGFHDPAPAVAFDAGYNVFVSDGRLLHVPEGADVGKLSALAKAGRAAPAGLVIYNDTRFPDAYRGLILSINAPRTSVRAFRVEPSGSTFEVTQEFELLKGGDAAFHSSRLVLGPDGAIYAGDDKHSRVYRLSWAGTKEHPAIPLRPMDSWAKIDKLDDAELLKTLESEDFSDRQYAQREIVRRGEKHRPALLKLLGDDERPTRARIAALSALQSFWNDAVQAAFVKALSDTQSDVRRLAADGLALNAKRGDSAVQETLARELNTPDLAVRRAVFLAIGKVGGAGAADTLMNALKADDGKDVLLRDGLVRAIEHLGKAGMQELLALADSGVDRDRDKVVEVFLATRTQPAQDALPTMLQNIHLSKEQKAGLVHVLAAAPEGAVRAGRMFLDGKLPETLRPHVVDALRRHAERNADAAQLLKRMLKGQREK
jgi:HEAT repeat protein